MFESVDERTYAQTQGRTDGRQLKSLPISSSLAFGSGELKMKALEWSQHFPHYKSMGKGI